MTFFLDSAFLIGLMDARDQYHRAAVQTWEQVLNTPASLLTSSLVLTEVVTYFNVHGHRRGLALISKLLLGSPRVCVRWVDEELWRAGHERLLLRPDKRWSLTDFVSFVLMEREVVREALTFDDHFAQAGFVMRP